MTAEAGEGWRAPSVTIEDLDRWEDNGAVWRPFEVTETARGDRSLQLHGRADGARAERR